MNKYVYVLLFSCLSMVVHGQSSKYLYNPDISYTRGLEMIENSNFTEARVHFEDFLTHNTDPVDARIPFARYYVAFSALNLYNLDAEDLFVQFRDEYPVHPKSLKANFDLGTFFYRDKNYKKAITYLEKVDYGQLTTDQQREARFSLGYSYFSQRQFDKALSNFNMLKSRTSEYRSASAYYAAYIEYSKKDYDEALQDLRIAEQGTAYKSLVPVFICNIYYQQGRYDDLLAYGQNMLESKQRMSGVRDMNLLVADAYFQKEEYANASTFYKEFKRFNKGKPTSEVALRMAITDFNLGNDEAAMADLKRIASTRSELGVVASYYLGGLYIRDNNLEFAAAAYKTAANQDLDAEIASKALYQYGKISADMGRSTEAINNLKRYMELHPDGEHITEVRELLAVAYLNSSNLDLAIEHLESLPAITGRSREAYQRANFLKANQLYNQRKYREAIESYDKSLRYPDDNLMMLQANFWKSEAYSIGRMFEEAVPGYRIVIRGSDRELKNKANYGMAYCLYNQRNYKEALPYFREFVNTYAGSKTSRIYQDGSLRLADCYYVEKSYSRAASMYSNAIQAGIREKDYAYMQLGTVESIDGDDSKAKGYLQRVIREFPKSSYVDDALFELANIDYENGQYQVSVDAFSRLIQEKPNSPYVPYALQRRAIAHYNLQTYGRTEEDYKAFLEKYPNHPEANSVLLGLQEVMNLNSKSSEFESILAAYKQAHPDSEGLEVVEYETAKGYYNNQEYDKAIASLTTFRESYPEDANSYEAQFLIAESYYRKGENFNALPIYYEVLAANQVSQTMRVVQRIADLEYQERNYDKAINYYERLEREAFTQRHTLNAWVGLMKSNFQKSQYDKTTEYADKILGAGTANVGTQNIATLFKGKVSFAYGNYEGAREQFQATIDNAKDVNAAEAFVLIGEVLFNEKKYIESNEHLFTIRSHFSVFDEWVGRGFLQIAENYIAMNEYLQARATLNSIIENTQSGIIANMAKVKLDRIDTLEKDLVLEQDTLQVDTLIVAPGDTTINNGGNNE